MDKTFFALGSLLLALSVAVAVRYIALLVRGARAKGTIVSVRSSELDGSVSWRPVIQFKDAEGVIREFVAPVGYTARPARESGIVVCYSRENPRNVVIVSFRYLWPLPAVLALFGVVALANAVGVLPIVVTLGLS